MIANAALAKYWVIQTHRRSVPMSSTTGLQSGFSVQGKPSQLVYPITMADMPSRVRGYVDTLITRIYGNACAKYRLGIHHQGPRFSKAKFSVVEEVGVMKSVAFSHLRPTRLSFASKPRNTGHHHRPR